MSDQQVSTSGENPATSGASDNKASAPESYSETFVKKLKTEKDNWATKAKTLEEKLREFEEKEKLQLETTLKEQNKWQEFAKIKEQERDEAFNKLKSMSERIESAHKFNALIEAIPGQVKKQYWGLIESHVADVVLNPQSGEPDPVSVKQIADKIRETYPEVIVFNDKRSIPQNAATNGQAFTLELWNSMSPKEKKENLDKYWQLKQKG